MCLREKSAAPDVHICIARTSVLTQLEMMHHNEANKRDVILSFSKVVVMILQQYHTIDLARDGISSSALAIELRSCFAELSIYIYTYIYIKHLFYGRSYFHSRLTHMLLFLRFVNCQWTGIWSKFKTAMNDSICMRPSKTYLFPGFRYYGYLWY